MNIYVGNYWIDKTNVFHTEKGSSWCTLYWNTGGNWMSNFIIILNYDTNCIFII